MLVHGLEVNKNLEYEKLMRIYDCGKAIKDLRDEVVKKVSEFKIEGFFATVIKRLRLKREIKKSLKELDYFRSEIVKVITNAEKPENYIDYIQDFLDKGGLKGKAVDGESPDPYGQILNIAVYIAVRLGKTPKQIIRDMTPDQTPAVISEITKKEVSDVMNMVSSNHSDPVKFFKTLSTQYRMADAKRRSAISKVKEKIGDQKVVQIASFKDMMKFAIQ